MSDPLPKQSWLTTLGWAAYLACSWTWCIGMFLPVLLVRDFGVWGFVVFAVPNVIGAAGLGWVLRDTGAAFGILRTHAWAIRAFSEVTWAFQNYFVIWLLIRNELTGLLGMLVAVAFLIALTNCTRRWNAPGRELLISAITWCASLAVGVGVILAKGLELPKEPPQVGSAELVWLAPVCTFGFLLCPYLDVTFLRARARQSATASRLSFLVGFGGLFSTMILFTLVYGRFFSAHGDPVILGTTKFVAAALCFHIAQQIGFTQDVHGAAIREYLGSNEKGLSRGIIAGILILAATLILLINPRAEISGMALGEVIYRVFMSFYGLVFPAYVWLCMIPFRGEPATQRPTRTRLGTLILVVALAAPCFWLGFIERQTWWLAPGLGVVLIARPVLALIRGRLPAAPRTQ